jgi:hypothetical protein
VNAGLDGPDVFVITPFRIVAQQMRELLAASDPVRRIADRPRHWARDRVGTVHTFRGRKSRAMEQSRELSDRERQAAKLKARQAINEEGVINDG